MLKENKPTFVLIGGPNGSGKSTLADKYRDKYTFVNPDEIQKKLHSGDEMQDMLRAGKETLKTAKELILNKKSFMLESTLSGNAHLKLLDLAKENGFKVRLIYVCLDTYKDNYIRVLPE